MDAKQVIRLLNLVPLGGEGGYYRETYRARGKIPTAALGGRHATERHFSTAIYFLLTPEQFSSLHRLPQDEIFHFYAGDPVELVQFSTEKNLSNRILGNDLEKGHQPQIVVPGDYWQGLRLVSGGEWALLGTTVAPGFNFDDFILGQREKLVREFPALNETILGLTRG